MDNNKDRGNARAALILMVRWEHNCMKDIFRNSCIWFNTLIPTKVRENDTALKKKYKVLPDKHAGSSLAKYSHLALRSISTGMFGKVCNLMELIFLKKNRLILTMEKQQHIIYPFNNIIMWDKMLMDMLSHDVSRDLGSKLVMSSCQMHTNKFYLIFCFIILQQIILNEDKNLVVLHKLILHLDVEDDMLSSGEKIKSRVSTNHAKLGNEGVGGPASIDAETHGLSLDESLTDSNCSMEASRDRRSDGHIVMPEGPDALINGRLQTELLSAYTLREAARNFMMALEPRVEIGRTVCMDSDDTLSSAATCIGGEGQRGVVMLEGNVEDSDARRRRW